MPYYALLFKGGLPHAELTKEYFDRFVEWAMRVAANDIPGNRFKQEGKVVSSERVDDLRFGDDTVGGYLMIEADNYDTAVDVAKRCPILEHGGSVEVREVISRTNG
jgi:hypothetical protein